MNTLYKKLYFLSLAFSLGSFPAQSSDHQELNEAQDPPCQTVQELEKDLFRFIAKRTYPDIEEEKKNTVIGALYAEEWSKTRKQYDILAALHYFDVAIANFQDEDAKKLKKELQKQNNDINDLSTKCTRAIDDGAPYEEIGSLYERLYQLTGKLADREYAEFYLQGEEEMFIDYSQRGAGLIFPKGNPS